MAKGFRTRANCIPNQSRHAGYRHVGGGGNGRPAQCVRPATGARHTGPTDDQVKLDSDRDYSMSAEEAKNYGLVDNVVESRKQLGPEMRPELLPPAGAGTLPSSPSAKPE